MSHFCNGALLWILCPCPVPEEHPTEASTPDATFVTDVRSANMIPCLQRSNSNLINSMRTPFARRNFRIFVLRRCVIWYLAWGAGPLRRLLETPRLHLRAQGITNSLLANHSMLLLRQRKQWQCRQGLHGSVILQIIGECLSTPELDGCHEIIHAAK